MANAVVSRLGQANLAGDARALFLVKYAGEVLTAFAENNVALERSMVRTIDNGKSAQFPVFGKGGAQYHTPGVSINGTTVAHAERIITIDDLLIADRFIASIDEAMNHYDVRAPYTRDTGRALAQAMDLNILRVGVLTARASASVTGGFGGTRIVSANSRTVAADLIAASFGAAQAMDEKDVPDTDRFLFLRPQQYYLLVNSGHPLINRDFSPDNGNVAEGVVYRVAGFTIVKTNNLPITNVTTGPTAYQGNFTNVTALAMHNTAVGTVKLKDLSTEMEYQIQRQGTLIVSKYACGHGILRPEAAVEIAIS
jgi:hypothetical protein